MFYMFLCLATVFVHGCVQINDDDDDHAPGPFRGVLYPVIEEATAV